MRALDAFLPTEVCQITVIAESDLRHSRVRVEHAGTVMRLVVTVDACELESSFCFVCCVAPEREWADTGSNHFAFKGPLGPFETW